MAYGRAGKGDEQGQERLVEELAEREEGAFAPSFVYVTRSVCWILPTLINTLV